MSVTTMPEERTTLFTTEDNQPVYEIGEDEGADVYVVGTVIVTEAKLIKRKGRWELKGTIPVRISE